MASQAPKRKRICDGSKYTKPDVLKLKEIFEAHDLDKNGKVTIAELIKALENNKAMSNKELSAFRTLDMNHDGVLTLDEYIRRIYPYATDKEYEVMISWTHPNGAGKSAPATFHPTPEQLDEIKGMFNYYDKNHDGWITLEELTTVAEACGYETKDIEELFRTTDKDADGRISFDEFIQLMRTSYI